MGRLHCVGMCTWAVYDAVLVIIIMGNHVFVRSQCFKIVTSLRAIQAGVNPTRCGKTMCCSHDQENENSQIEIPDSRESNEIYENLFMHKMLKPLHRGGYTC